MKKLFDFEEKIQDLNTFHSSLEEILRTGARKLLQQAIEHEVHEYIEIHKSLKDVNGRNLSFVTVINLGDQYKQVLARSLSNNLVSEIKETVYHFQVLSYLNTCVRLPALKQ